MIDISTNEPLCVSTAGDAGSYIMVPVEQINDVRRILDANRVPYWVDEQAIRLNDEPEITVVNLSGEVDPHAVQAMLDRET